MLLADHCIDAPDSRIPTAIVVATTSANLTTSAKSFLPRARLEAVLRVANDNGGAWYQKRHLARNMLRALEATRGW